MTEPISTATPPEHAPADRPKAPRRGVPRWPAFLAALAIGGIYLVISHRFTIGPNWLVLALVLALLLPAIGARRLGMPHVTRTLVLVLLGVLTCAIVVSAALLIAFLLRARIAAQSLLIDAALIWCGNVLVFALWYWEIDGGGPAHRRHDHRASEDFLFPQMASPGAVSQPWSPEFIDYLFLAFNTSAAFSPTDTLVLSRRAKVLMMAQSIISLVVIAVLFARAINTL